MENQPITEIERHVAGRKRKWGETDTKFALEESFTLRQLVPMDLIKAMCEEQLRKDIRWTNIFNNPRNMWTRRTDGPDRRVAYAVHPRRLQRQNLPELKKWGELVLHTMHSIHSDLPEMVIGFMGYICATTTVPQHFHRDISLSVRGRAFSVFSPTNIYCPDDDENGSRWINNDGVWEPMGSHPGDVFIMDSRRVHRGGGKPLCCKKNENRYVAFAAITEKARTLPKYENTVPVSVDVSVHNDR